ncbi:unnamed protein product, partial [Pylaiella littoralis]
MLHILSHAGEKKSEADIVRIIRRRLPDRLYLVEKRSVLIASGLSREKVEESLRSAFARYQSAKLLGSTSSAVATSPSHALVFGAGGNFRRGGGRGGVGSGAYDGHAA